MGECTGRLNWVEHDEPGKGFLPRKLRSATTSIGLYEVLQNGNLFDAWLSKRSNGALVFLGTSQTANGARDMCERNFKDA